MTRVLFTALCALVAAQRLLEVRTSRRHQAALVARGGREHARRQMPWMIAMHAGWLVAAPLEVWLAGRPFQPVVALVAGGLFVTGQLVRRAARRALGPRWTVRVITLPGEALVSDGPFAAVQHPNYLGVALEIAALPLLHGAWITAVVFSALNALMMAFRIPAEERALGLRPPASARAGRRSAGTS